MMPDTVQHGANEKTANATAAQNIWLCELTPKSWMAQAPSVAKKEK